MQCVWLLSVWQVSKSAFNTINMYRKLLWFIGVLVVLTAQAHPINRYTVYEQVNDENINTIVHWRQLTYARKQVNSRNWVYKTLKKLERSHRYDSLQLVDMVDSLGRWADYCFFYDLCCRPIDFSRKNPFTHLASLVQRYGGYRQINHYYLKDSVAYSLPTEQFNQAVYYAWRNKTQAACYFAKPEEPKITPPQRAITMAPDSIRRALAARPGCDSVLLITDENNNEITSPYQLSFINPVPVTATDSIINKIMAADGAGLPALVDALGQTRSFAAYCLLYTCCVRGWIIKDLNPMNGLAGAISGFGGYQALNKYFLNNAVSAMEPMAFAGQVILACKKNEPACYYCKPEEARLKTKREMEAIDTRKYDREIIKIIRRNSDLSKVGGFIYHSRALDSIEKQLNELPFVGDVYYDRCETKIDIYPGWAVLGVIIMVNNKPVEKCYYIQLGRIGRARLRIGRHIYGSIKMHSNNDFLVYQRNYVDPGFIYRQKELCNPN